MPVSSLGKSRQSTFTKVSFPTVPSIRLQPVKIDFTEESGMHDLLTMQFSVANYAWIKTLKTGIPVKFSFSQGSYSREWVGYVSNVTTHTAGQLQEIMEVHCIGATFPLKERDSKVFTNVSIPNAVQQIVEQFGFKFIGEDNGVIFDQITIAGHSYWEWLQEQAKKIGYGIVVDGLAFIFKPLDKIIYSGVTSLPTFAMFGKGTGINNMQDDRTLDWLQVKNGEHIESGPNSRAVKNLGGVSPISETAITSTSNPNDVGTPVRDITADVLFSQVSQEHVSNSSIHAEILAQGAAQNSRFNMPAKLKGQGDPRIRLLSPVAVLGTSDLNDGIWIVKKASHHFSSNHNYQVDLDIVTDGFGNVSANYKQITEKSISGVVNLTDALNNNGRNPNLVNSGNRALKIPQQILSESNQGWKRTPSLWVYTDKG
jgi:hypothetical protein